MGVVLATISIFRYRSAFTKEASLAPIMQAASLSSAISPTFAA
jgi:hypothetical protein